MSSRALKILAVVMLVVAAIAGLFAYRMGTQYARAPQPVSEPEEDAVETTPKTLVVVAVSPLAANATIGRDDVQLVPVTVAPERYFSNVDDVVGRTPLVDIDAGAPVTPRYFRDANLLARIIPKGAKALSMQIDDVIAVGGFVRPGDVVDILVFLRGAGESPSQVRYLLKQALVLGYEERIIDRPQGVDGTEESRRQRVRTAVLAVPDAYVPRVVLGASVGDLRLALHAQREDNEDTGTEAGLPFAEAAQSDASTPDNDGVITREELAGIEKKQQTKPRTYRPPVYVYRGTDLEAVRP